MTTENQATLTAAELIENEHGRFHPNLTIENNMQPIKWIKEHGLKAQIVEIEDAEHSLTDWQPESSYEDAFPVAIFQTDDWADDAFTAIFAYENSKTNREIKLQRLARLLDRNDNAAAAYLSHWLEHNVATTIEAARTKAKRIEVGDVTITDPEQIKWFKLGMQTAAFAIGECPVTMDWNR